jgi:hypothetical protein
MLRLGEVLLAEGDVEAARDLQGRLSPYAADDERLRTLFQRIEEMPATAPVVTVAERAAAIEQVRPAAVQEALHRGFRMSDEIACAWNLQQAGELTPEEYAQVVQDLTEMSASNASMTASLMHVLESRQFKNLPRIMAFAAGQTRTPVLSLSGYEMTTDILALLPVEFMVQRGALVFGQIEKDVLAVVMNPYSKTIRDDVATITGRKCHFYMALPSEFDTAVARIADLLAEKALEAARASAQTG